MVKYFRDYSEVEFVKKYNRESSHMREGLMYNHYDDKAEMVTLKVNKVNTLNINNSKEI